MHTREQFLSHCKERASTAAFARIFWKIFSVFFSHCGCADCRRSVLLTAVNEACDTPETLLMGMDLISSDFFTLQHCLNALLYNLCLWREPHHLLHSAPHVKSSATTGLTPLPCHHVTTSHGAVSSTTAIQGFLGSEFGSLSAEFRNFRWPFWRNYLSWDLFKAQVWAFMWWELNYPSLWHQSNGSVYQQLTSDRWTSQKYKKNNIVEWWFSLCIQHSAAWYITESANFSFQLLWKSSSRHLWEVSHFIQGTVI